MPYLWGTSRFKAIHNQLVGLYPGDIEKCDIEIQKNRGIKNSFLVFVFEKNTRDRSILISTLFIKQILDKNDSKAVFLGDSWIEFTLLRHGGIVNSVVKNREDNGAIYNMIENYYKGENTRAGEKIEVFCYQSDHFLFTNKGYFTFNLHIIEKELLKISIEKISLFIRLNPRYRMKWIIISFISIGIIIATISIVYHHNFSKKIIHQNMQNEQEIVTKILEAEKKEQMYLTELKNKYAMLVLEKKITLYEIIEIISYCLTDDAIIINETIREGFFQFEAYAPDALAILKRFEKHSQVSSSILQQIYPENGRERFTITGTVVPKIIQIDHTLSVQEQRLILEKLIKSLEIELIQKIGYSPSLLGVSIRALLHKWGCAINSYKYLNSNNMHEVEFSIHTKSLSFFYFLHEAVTSKAGWEFKHIQLRNLAPQNTVDVVFSVGGNIGIELSDNMPFDERNNEYTPLNVSSIIKNYYIVPSVNTKIPVTNSIEPDNLPDIVPKTIAKASWLEFLGIVGDNIGNQYIYIKDTKENQVLKLNPYNEGNMSYIELANGVYKIYLDNKIYEIRRK
jgi:hypothetical protein